MKSWKKFPRFILLITLLTSMLVVLSAPVFVGESVNAAPMIQAGMADLSLTQVVNNASPLINDYVVFTITVTNLLGSSDATGVQVRDALLSPADLEHVSNDSGGTYDPVTGIWLVGALANGTSKTLNITAKVKTPGAKTNSAEVWRSDQPDPDSTPGNGVTTPTEDDYADVVVTPSGGEANLSLVLDWSKQTPGVAGNIVFAITISNTGPYDATDVQVKDLLPTGFTYVADNGGGTYNKTSGIWSVGTVPNGANKILNITAKVVTIGTNLIRANVAEVWKSDQADPNSTPGNGETTPQEDDYGSTTPTVADLSLTKTMSNVIPSVGQLVVFVIVINNAAGFDDAFNVQVRDLLPSSFNYVSDDSNGAYDKVSGIWTVSDSITPFLSGASKTLTITTTLNTSALIINQAEVYKSDQIDPDSVPGNSSKIEDDYASAPTADLSLAQAVSNLNPDINANITFAVTVTNGGVGGTTNVQVKDLLPSGLTYVADNGGGTYAKSTGIWTVGTLVNGASKSLNITAKVTSMGIRTNWAEVWRSDQRDPDSTPGNGSKTEDDDASATITSYRSVIINEIAWAGTAAALPNDEWIELYNPSNAAINITGWTLKSTSSSLDITLSGSIPAGGYFLLERDDNSTVSDITADQIYTGSLSNSGEVLTLRDNLADFIDTANGNGGPWPKGSATTFGTMERTDISTESDTTWRTNTGNIKNGKNANGGAIIGTPRKRNSSGSTFFTATPPRVPTRTPTIIPPVGRPILNEILPRPGFDWNQDGKADVFDEFIEIKNVGNGDINMQGWKLDDKDSISLDSFTLPSVILKPGDRVVFYGSQSNLHLSDGGETVRLLNPNNKILDAYTYPIAKVEDQSICRLPDSTIFGSSNWFEDCTPTPNLANTREGVVPSVPQAGFQPADCGLPDTLPADFLLAECHGYGANIWSSFYWDKDGWHEERYIPENTSKWGSFVE